MIVSPLYLNQADAGRLGLSARTLECFRIDGRGPKYLKLGRRVAYSRDDLMAWVESRRRSSTSDDEGPADLTNPEQRSRHVR